MFHKDIKKENKERLITVIDIIQDVLTEKGYNMARVSTTKICDALGIPINQIAFGFIKNDIEYKITLEIVGSKY